ncbi:MAG: 2-C-methyl-D-erythritol 4-phosphate cytidylyltransferase [Paracoccaceae bacterium]|nr:2-C-methyl-D-erythritol 4-phosphate cytidylyltransferase [Paracoccaceae bacterium]
MPTKTAVIIVAAGKGMRFGSRTPKQFLLLKDIPILSYSLRIFINHQAINSIQPVINDKHDKFYWKALGSIGKSEKILSPTFGGDERSLSVKSGLLALAKLKEPPEKVLIHDAARPLVSKKVIDRVLQNLSNFDAVFPVLPLVDALWKVEKNKYELLKDRNLLFRAQTPQGFNFSMILEAHLKNTDYWALDDISLATKLGVSVKHVTGCESNLKITTSEDLKRAERFIE